MPPLNSNGAAVSVGQATLRTPGLAGDASEVPLVGDGLRANTQTTDVLEAALESHGVTRQQVIELRNTREVGSGGGFTRSTPFDEPAIELQVPDPGPDNGQVVLYTDEAGICTWNLPQDEQGGLSTTRSAGAKRTYLIRRAVGRTPDGLQTRGAVGAIGKKLLQVLVFPLVDRFVGRVAEGYAAAWEEHNRPYRVRTFGPSDYEQPSEVGLTPAQWQQMATGRALLFVHGTFSRAHLAFPTLPHAVFDALNTFYGGRLFAFDHFTVSDDPLDNAKRFVQSMPPGTKLELDMICHSRGGLVARALTEEQGQLGLDGRQLTVGKVVFAGSPNAGCVLADPKYMNHFIDRYTNWVNFLPSTGVLEILEGILTVVKQLAVGALGGLKGLESMVPIPSGEFLRGLTQGNGGNAQYFALASNYEPPDNPDLKSFAHNALMDQILGADNDLVVPTKGVYEAHGSLFPIAEPSRLVFSSKDHVDHGGYFANEAAGRKLLSWLTGST